MEKSPSANVEGLFSWKMSSAAQECAVDVVRAESARFRHPLLMIHGLWTGGWIWKGFAGYLAHRGWDSWLPSVCGATLEQRAESLWQLARTLPAPPIIMAHDAGFATAVELAARVGAPTVVAIAPLLSRRDGGTLAIFSGIGFWPARFGARDAAPPRGDAARVLLRGLDPNAAARLAPDSGSFFRAALAGGVTGLDPRDRPGLVIASHGDPMTPVEAAQRFAVERQWAFDLHGSTGHFPMMETGFESLADRLHRWLVRALGEDLLVLLDDEEGGE